MLPSPCLTVFFLVIKWLLYIFIAERPHTFQKFQLLFPAVQRIWMIWPFLQKPWWSSKCFLPNLGQAFIVLIFFHLGTLSSMSFLPMSSLSQGGGDLNWSQLSLQCFWWIHCFRKRFHFQNVIFLSGDENGLAAFPFSSMGKDLEAPLYIK